MPEEAILWETTIHGGETWSHILKRGTCLRVTDTEGSANVAALFYNAANHTERFNLPDTLKAQHIARLTKGFVLYSDMGRVLCSIIGDTLGWHDPLGGYSNAALVHAKYGEAPYQQCRNEWHQDAFTGLLLEIGKYGMTERDLTASLNLFSKVWVDETGAMHFVENHSPAGSYVDLRPEMDTLVVLNTCQHPMDPNPRYQPKPVQVSVRRVPPPAGDDLCRRSRPENERGFINTERYHL
jgi:uncharacterized protein